MAQLLHSKIVVNSILFCRKNLELYEERLHYRSYSFNQIHKSMSRYHNKDIKMLVALLPTLKTLLSVEINSKVIEAIAGSCSLKKLLSKLLKNSQENISPGVCFFKIRLKEKKGNSSTHVFPWILLILFRTLLLNAANA